MKKLIIIILVIMVLALTCTGAYYLLFIDKVQTENVPVEKESVDENDIVFSKEDHEIKIKEVMSNYKEGKIISVNYISDQFMLIEHQIETFSNKFYIHDLKSGDVDILPTSWDFVTLEEITDENNITFLSSGEVSESIYRVFPYIIKCYRTKSDIDRMDDFIAVYEDKYFDLETPITSGTSSSDKLTDVVVTLDSIQILFTSKEGEEPYFYAGFTDIPVTNISYDDMHNDLIIQFKDTTLDGVLMDDYEISIEKYNYVESISIQNDGNDVYAILELKTSGIEYLPKIKRIGFAGNSQDDLPYLEIKFREKH